VTGEAGALIDSAAAAAGRGAIEEAVDLLERALVVEDRPDGELLGALAYTDDRMDVVCREWDVAVRGYGQCGRPREVARVATRVSEVHWSVLGNPAAGRGWTERARRLLERAGPCVEWDTSSSQ
jgi:hypothetical protein